MKFALILISAAATLSAQAPPSNGPETVVAKVDGKPVTLGELQHVLQAFPPSFMQTFQRDPKEAIKQLFMVRYTAAEGDKLKLGDMEPWKEQIEIQRMNIVSAAMFNYTRNIYNPSMDDLEAYYNRNKSRYEEASIKVIKIGFKPGMTGNLSVEEMAKRALENAHAGSDRSEAEARTLATGLVKQLRTGSGNFAELVKLYSDDADSKANGGDFGTVKPSSPYAEDFKRAVFALQPGEVSDPVQTGPAFYIARVESKTVQPFTKVREQILEDVKDDHFREFLAKLQERFTPVIERPDVLMQMNSSMAQQRVTGK